MTTLSKLRSHRSYLLMTLVVIASLLPAIAHAQDSAAGSADPFYGSYGEAKRISAPAFHGIEPRLSLAYNSSGSNGLVGVGWSLSGIDFVQRVSPGKGTPAYDATDTFLLIGEELIPCNAQNASPSCKTGG